MSIELRTIAFLGPESVWAAEAAECANDQDSFLDYHDTLFERQGDENSGAFAIDNLKGFALDVGLDTDAFNSCLDSHEHLAEIDRVTGEAFDAGVDSTPTVFVGDKKLTSIRSFADVAEAIDKELETAS